MPIKNKKQINRCKDLIVYNVLLYLKKNNVIYKNIAMSNIETFSKYYHIDLKRMKQFGYLEQALLAFIINKEGYSKTIVRLYNELR